MNHQAMADKDDGNREKSVTGAVRLVRKARPVVDISSDHLSAITEFHNNNPSKKKMHKNERTRRGIAHRVYRDALLSFKCQTSCELRHITNVQVPGFQTDGCIMRCQIIRMLL
mmetsp:Transcript_8646/g.15653  ORF Transcript_8646/g.15653 Transcript_8646/m.15653 type:complete len:113 (+) Transcript_8646:153-491(+)